MQTVFSQALPSSLDIAALVRNATRYFTTELEILSLSALPSSAMSPRLDATTRPMETDARADSEALTLAVRINRAAIAPASAPGEVAQQGVSGVFRVHGRLVQSADLEAARRAEQRGRSGGMATLAQRCRGVFELVQEGGVESEAAELLLSAIFASVALGPVLPSDESALYGVRGAMTRFEASAGSTLLRP